MTAIREVDETEHDRIAPRYNACYEGLHVFVDPLRVTGHNVSGGDDQIAHVALT